MEMRPRFHLKCRTPQDDRHQRIPWLVKEPDDLSSNVFSSRLLVIHNAGTRRQYHVAELSARQQLHHPLFQVFELDIVSRRNDSGLVQAAVQLDDDLAVSVVVDLFELANVACSLLVSHYQ